MKLGHIPPSFDETNLFREDASARYKLVEALFHFVREGLRDFDGRVNTDVQQLKALVLGGYARSLMNDPQPTAPAPAEAAERASQAFLHAFQQEARAQGYPRAPAPSMRVGASQGEPVPPVAPTAEGACLMAQYRKRKAQSRSVVLGMLARLLREAPCPELAAAQEALSLAVRQAERDEMMFAIVEGGALLADIRSQLLAEHLTPQHSLIQYLSAENSVPHRWPAGLEESFYAELQEAAKVAP